MMHDISFETPENVKIHYNPAGLGSRFIAAFIDHMLIFVLMFVLLIAFLAAGFTLDMSFRDVVGNIDNLKPGEMPQISSYFLGAITLIWGLGSFFYFGLSEYLMHGQTIGKKQAGVRVVSEKGFSLDATCILIRSIFRVIDNIPVFWIVPFLSEKSQRLGDLVGGTIVVKDEKAEISDLREMLLSRSPADSEYRFDLTGLRRIRPNDYSAIEKILERMPTLKPRQYNKLLDTITIALADKLKIEHPIKEKRKLFLEDLLAAEYRRQYRQLS